ncbi:MAG: molybdopterin-dependent oxidoreductase, partial [Thiobacillaceae bacterium]|nr:molybdopterin-dependent oxidoreductase [Thiobacillaceae bacterium]
MKTMASDWIPACAGMTSMHASKSLPVRSTCPYCGVGCGLLVSREGDVFSVRGDPEHPANRGRLCSKGAALGETLSLEDRLLYPEIGGEQVSWDTALETVASRFARVIAEHGPEAVAFYVSGQLLTEDYYVANKLMKGFIGAANIDTNSRLCMSSAVAGHKRAFGSDTVPGCYEDLELADLVVLVGSNAAWTHPVLYQRMAAAKAARPGMRVVLVDPRRTATADLADLHLAIRPGADAWLFHGLLNHLKREDTVDWAWLEAHVEGFGAAFAAVRDLSIPRVARECGLDEADVAEFFRLFAATPRTVTAFSQGINQSSSGVDKVNAILNVHLATGRIGQPGATPFSLTGQPNAMGGREVGGLANQLAAHMDFDADALDRVGRFWNAPNLARAPGLKAVDLFEAVGAGRIKALWIMATNPVVSMPEADAVQAAIGACEFVVVSDVTADTDTAALAHVRLPAAAWGEKDGTVSNSERRVSRQRAFLTLPGEARPDWWIVAEVAKRMGYGAAFDYEGPAAIFREHAALSGFENAGRRDFDLSGLLSSPPLQSGEWLGYDALAPVQWPVRGRTGTSRLFADGRFYTPSGKARMLAAPPRGPARPPDGERPYVLNTGRIRDQWHSMTRTGKTARLLAHIDEPCLAVHPADLARSGLRAGSLARVSNEHGELLARVVESREQTPGQVFAPIHWNNRFSGRARVGVLVNAITDPVSGQPEFKQTPVALEAYAAAWHGFVLSRTPLAAPDSGYWTRVRAKACWRLELAGMETSVSWPETLRDRFGAAGDWIELRDPAAGRYRAALLRDGRLEMACFFDAAAAALPPRHWLEDLFTKAGLEREERIALLAGRPATAADDGAIVCACFGVGEKALKRAIAEGADSLEA